jgi:hypothetical protein
MTDTAIGMICITAAVINVIWAGAWLIVRINQDNRDLMMAGKQ